MSALAPRLRVGCSGWQYKHWRGDFYPADLPVSRWLEHYATLGRLEAFLRTLPRHRTHVVEFRDPTWYVDDVFDALGRHGVSLCLHDMAVAATGLRLGGHAPRDAVCFPELTRV